MTIYTLCLPYLYPDYVLEYHGVACLCLNTRFECFEECLEGGLVEHRVVGHPGEAVGRSHDPQNSFYIPRFKTSSVVFMGSGIGVREGEVYLATGIANMNAHETVGWMITTLLVFLYS